MTITGRSSALIVLFLILPPGSITTMINDHASCIEIKQRFEGDMMNGASTHHQHIKKPTVTMRLRRGESATWDVFRGSGMWFNSGGGVGADGVAVGGDSIHRRRARAGCQCG